MPNRLLVDHLSAELSTLDRILSTLPQDDVLGRMSLESRKTEVVSEISQLQGSPEQLASVALFFGGKPVVGAQGIESTFAAETVSGFQQLITNLWASEEGEVGRRGPVEGQEKSALHITTMLHGSVGFLLEELDPQNRISPSRLKQASDKAASIVAAFTDENEDAFKTVLETVDSRVLGSAREFLKHLHSGCATLRLIEGEKELQLSPVEVERAYERAESATIDEQLEEISGELLGLIPIGRRFEIRLDDGKVISGSVAPTLSESYLKRLEDEQFVGKSCKAYIMRRQVKRFNRTTETVILRDLKGDQTESVQDNS